MMQQPVGTIRLGKRNLISLNLKTSKFKCFRKYDENVADQIVFYPTLRMH